MTRLDARAEPSMEDILASIRKIIAEDGSRAPPLKPRLPADDANEHHEQDARHSTNGRASALDSAQASNGLTGHTSSEAAQDDNSELPSSEDHRRPTAEAIEQHHQAPADHSETSASSYTRMPGPKRPGFTVMRDGFLPEHGEPEPSAEDAFANELGANDDDNTEETAKAADSAGFSFDLGPSPFAKEPDQETTAVAADSQTPEEPASHDADLAGSDDLESIIDDTIDDAFGSENDALNTNAGDAHDVETTTHAFEPDQHKQERGADSDETFDSGDDRSKTGTRDRTADSAFAARPQAEPETSFDQQRASSESDASTARSPDRPMFGFPSGDSKPSKRPGGFGTSHMRGRENRNDEEEASYTPVRSAARDVLNVAEPEPTRGRGDRKSSSYADAVTEHLASIDDRAASSSTANLYDRKSESEAARSNARIGDAFEAVATTIDEEQSDEGTERSKNALTVSDPDQRAIEDTVADLLRPMLKSWLAENMPKIVERALRREINELKLGASHDDRDDN